MPLPVLENIKWLNLKKQPYQSLVFPSSTINIDTAKVGLGLLPWDLWVGRVLFAVEVIIIPPAVNGKR